MEKAENADGIHPPLLTGIGHKSRTPWLKSVLTQGGKARPWMQLRMPQYGEANVGHLPESLAFLEGLNVDDTVHKVTLTASNVANGKAIVGKGGLGCISCHDIAGIPNTGTRGPDLATINQRVRFDWYERWLHQPLRMAPGTRMPQAFVDNKSTLATVLNGDPKQQADAMWAYLSLGTGLPLPEGLEPPKGLVIGVKERPEILRTFMPDAGNKSIAVGYPGGVSVAFSADECRLTYAWAGNFLDASPVWNNRGGARRSCSGRSSGKRRTATRGASRRTSPFRRTTRAARTTRSSAPRCLWNPQELMTAPAPSSSTVTRWTSTARPRSATGSSRTKKGRS